MSSKENEGSLRRLLEAGDFFLATALATSLTKLVLRSMIDDELEASQQNAFSAEVLLIFVNILKLGKSSQVKIQIDEVLTHTLPILSVWANYRSVW